MTKIYLIRHAQAEGNLYRMLQAQNETLLTEEGLVQIRALAERFREIPVTAVYSSDLHRAEETAAGICAVKGLPLHSTPELQEINTGHWAGLPVGEIRRAEPEQAWYFSHDQSKWHLPDGETPRQATERMLNALRKIAADNEGGQVAVVSHGAAIRYVVGHLKGVPLKEISYMTTGKNTGVTELEIENGEIRLISFDDGSHLDLWMEKLLGHPYHERAVGLEAGLWYEKPQQEESDRWMREALELRAEDACPVYGEGDALIGLREEGEAGKVGIVTMLPELEADTGRGWIDVLWVKPDMRCRGYGIQLVGRALYRYREMGRSFLRAAVKQENTVTLEFLSHHGFRRVDTRPSDGSLILEKSIGVPKKKL